MKSFNLFTSKNSIEIKREKKGWWVYVFGAVKKKKFRKKNLDVCAASSALAGGDD